MARTLLRRLTRRLEPYVDQITDHPWVKRYAPRLAEPDLWHLNRRSSARAVAVGLFSGLVPGPFQVLSAVGLSILFRAHFPLAAITTLYTNPLTIVPLYLVAYQYGGLFVAGDQKISALHPPEFDWSTDYAMQFMAWMGSLGKPLAVGLPSSRVEDSCTRPITMPSRANSEPTDRSMLREMIENVSGMATSASAADCEIIVCTRLRLTHAGLTTANAPNAIRVSPVSNHRSALPREMLTRCIPTSLSLKIRITRLGNSMCGRIVASPGPVPRIVTSLKTSSSPPVSS